MIVRLVLMLGLVLGVILLVNWFLRTPPQRLAPLLRRGALYGGIGLLLILTVTGRLPWLFALIGAAIPLLRRGMSLMRIVPHLRRLFGMSGGATQAPGGGTGQTSSIQTRFLRATLEHDSGKIDATVLEGTHAGRRLSELDLAELLGLLPEYRAADPSSARVLEAYLERAHGDRWRAQSGEAETGPEPPGSSARMDEAEAWQVLGLAPGATVDEIRETHRRLMQRLHPDRGGSTYLAAQINRAKDILLARGTRG